VEVIDQSEGMYQFDSHSPTGEEKEATIQEYLPAHDNHSRRDASGELRRLQDALLTDRDGQLSATCLRLTRIAQARGVAADAIDDVVQETLLEAWNHLDRLYTPEGFHAWIDEICRNICRRYAHRRTVDLLRHTPLSWPYSALEQSSGESEADLLTAIPDADAPDPLEELSRQDLVQLLDQALGILPQATRQMVEMCHLLELPHSEVAERLGISSGTLDTRLHRARRQLLQILSGPLRNEAEAFGLTLDKDLAEGWRETRLWCPLCSRHRLQGSFIEFESGESPNLHMRCPDCSRRYGLDTVHSMGLVSLAGLRSFRPAWKRSMQGLTDLMLEALPLGLHPCLCCGKPASVQVRGIDTESASPPSPYPFWIYLHCAYCGEDVDVSGCVPSVDQLVYWSHPLTRQFMQQHPHWKSEPGTPIEYDGQQAIHFQIADVESTANLTVLAHRKTLRVLTLG
jgi:RNA polymerase sigma factor (sigma-70 family)